MYILNRDDLSSLRRDRMKNATTTGPTVADLVAVERCGGQSFVGTPTATARASVFGGQLAGQTMSAAAATVDDRYPWPTSLQLYFISAPDPTLVIHYDVTVRRNGGRFGWRNVVARQGDRVVVDALVAFQSTPAPPAPCKLADEVPGPEELLPPHKLELLHGELVGHYFQRLGTDQMDTRFVQGPPPLRLARGDTAPRHQLWVRPLGLGAMSPKEVGCCLAYLSDVTVLATPMISIGRLGDGRTDFASSFDHSLRFYSGLEEIPWLIYDQSSATVAGLTLEAHGRMATRDGRLVASVTQQGVLMLLPGQE